MPNPAFHTVVTTIQLPTKATKSLQRKLADVGGSLIIIGDKKGPFSYPLENVQFLPLQAQIQLPFQICQLLPTGHYTRKNIGYLVAIKAGATCIYETDDDNAPLPHWSPRSVSVDASPVKQEPWCNAYSHFSNGLIWPRGFPLDLIRPTGASRRRILKSRRCHAPIQQGLANGSPDVDAVWRLVLDQDFQFQSKPSIMLAPGSWCPFNSQSTWWWPEAYPLLYLPSYCSFRMTDIWRSFVAQRCLWEIGAGLVFHGAEVVQERNFHDLMRDFNDEIPGYQNNRMICSTLSDLKLKKGIASVSVNLRKCYSALVAEGIVPKNELTLVDAWIRDLVAATGDSKRLGQHVTES